MKHNSLKKILSYPIGIGQLHMLQPNNSFDGFCSGDPTGHLHTCSIMKSQLVQCKSYIHFGNNEIIIDQF